MEQGLITARGGLNLRKSPKTGNVIRALRKGSKVEILEEETWLKVRTRDGKTGFVLADHVERDSSSLVNHSNASQGPEIMDVAALADKEQDQFIIKTYTNTQFVGKEMRVDVDFIPHLDRLNQYALECGVNVYVTSSTREPGRAVSGQIVKAASRSNHLVGHAIDMNLQSKSGFFNSTRLKRSKYARLPAEIKKLIGMIRADETLRWGGDFNKEDPVHIDDRLNRRNPKRWESKLASRKSVRVAVNRK